MNTAKYNFRISMTLLTIWLADVCAFASPATPPAQANPKAQLARLFQYKMIGAQIPYLESLLGPAMRINPDKSREYEIGDCKVTIFPSGDAIDAIRLELTSGCTFDVRRMGIGMDFPTANAITFGTFAKEASGAKFLSDCLTLCGNAYDPSVYLYWQGPHSASWMEVLVGAPLVTSPILTATSTIQDAMKKRDGDDYIMSTKFNCDTRYDQLAVNTLQNIPITFIEIGYHTKPDGLSCN